MLSQSDTTRFSAPDGFADEDDLPIKPLPDIPRWSENFWFGSWDQTAGLGVWLHVTRIPHDPTLWRQLVFLYLPDGSVLLGKQYGRNESERGPGSATLSFTCVEPWNEWNVRFDSVLVRSYFEQLDRALLPDGKYVPAALDLTWKPISPIWNIGSGMERQSWGDIHHEQLGGLSGSVRYGETEVQFDGVGLRDHTRGARDWQPFVRHCWLHGVFGPDSGFMIADMELDEHRLRRAAVLDNGHLEEVFLEDSPLLDSRMAGHAGYRIGFEGHDPIEAEILHNNAIGMASDNDVVLGFDPDVASHAVFEGFTQFTWNGRVGYGLTERSFRVL